MFVASFLPREPLIQFAHELFKLFSNAAGSAFIDFFYHWCVLSCLTSTALTPLLVISVENSTHSPSLRGTELSISVIWTKTSLLPSSGVMNLEFTGRMLQVRAKARRKKAGMQSRCKSRETHPNPRSFHL